MTSQKSSKNNVNFNDFKRSLLGSVLFPAVALAVMLFCITAGVIDFFYGPISQTITEHDYVYIFFDDVSIFYDYFPLLQTGMVLCGMMTAAKSFYFLLSKKQVNVYLSLGVTRIRMFFNRLGAGAISLFTSVFVPFTISYLINMKELGVTSQLRNVYLYILFSLFVAAMAGFAISSFAMMVSGNIFESVLTMGTMSFLPILIANIFYVARDVMLKGYTSGVFVNDNRIFLNPFTFINNSEQENFARGDYEGFTTVNSLVNSFRKSDLVNGAIPEDYAVDWEFIRPVVIWFIISVALTILTLFLFNKRKAEHSNSLGKFALSRIINGACAVCIVCMGCVGVLWYEIDTIGVTLASIGLSFVVYFIVQLILTRKLKKALKSLSMCAVFMVIFVGFVSFIETGYFGTYNKLPEKDNVKAVSITVSEDFAHNNPFPYHQYIISTNPDDISMVMSLFDEIKKDDGADTLVINSIFFEIETKDGEILSREFEIYSPDLYNKYTETVVNSNFFDGVLEYEFLGFDENNKSKNGEYTYITSDRYMISEPDKVAALNYYDSQLLVPYVPTEKESQTDEGYVEYYGDEGKFEDGEPRQFEIYKGDDLAVAFYNDLSKMTYNELCKNNNKVLGVLGWESDYVCQGNDEVTPADPNDEEYMYDAEENNDIAGVKTIYPWLSITSEMTETIAYLEENQIEFVKTYNVPIKQVLYTDSKLMFADAQREFIEQVVEEKGESEYYKRYFSRRTLPRVSFHYTTALYDSFYSLKGFISEKITKETLLKKVYADIGHPLKAVDKDNIDKVVDASVGTYNIHNDDGRMIFIIYEDGSMIAKYLPEANIGVLK